MQSKSQHERKQHQRLGIFYLDRALMVKDPLLVKRIMGECLIWRAELRYWDNVEYIAECQQFREVPHGAELPIYTWKFDGGRPLAI